VVMDQPSPPGHDGVNDGYPTIPAAPLQASGCIHPYRSGLRPYWMPTSSSRSIAVTGPAAPSATAQSPPALRAAPIGVMTAAVPQAKTSVISPAAQPSLQSSAEIRPSNAGTPRSGPSLSSESRVMPCSSDPVVAGVSIRASAPDPYTNQMFMPPISSTQR